MLCLAYLCIFVFLIVFISILQLMNRLSWIHGNIIAWRPVIGASVSRPAGLHYCTCCELQNSQRKGPSWFRLVIEDRRVVRRKTGAGSKEDSLLLQDNRNGWLLVNSLLYNLLISVCVNILRRGEEVVVTWLWGL